MPFARSRFLGIRARMIGLVAVTALPLAVVAARFAIDHLEHEKANAYERVTTLARSSATRLDDEIGNVATLLLSLGHAVAIDKGYVAANDLLLRRIQAELPDYFNGLAVFDADGDNIGIAPFLEPDRTLLSSKGRDYFEAALRGETLAVSQPLAGPLSQRPQIVIGSPVRRGDDRRISGVVAVGLILESLARIFDHADLPPGAVVRLSNDKGIVLARSSHAAEWVGRNLSDDPWIRGHLEAGFAVGEVTWADGIRRLTASVTPSRVPWVVSVGIPAELALAGLKQSYWQTGLIGGGAILLALIAAWVMSRRIAGPVRELASDAQKFVETNFRHRSQVRSRSEIGQLAAALNATADRVADTQQRLQRVGDDLSTLIQASPIPVLAADRDGKATLWNGAAERLWGYPADEVIGGPPPIGARDAADTVSLLFRRALAGEAILGLDLRLLTKDGRPVDVRMFAAPLPDSSGGTRGVVSLWLDLTEQSALEARLRQSQKMQAVGQLAGGIAHDINNILGVTVANLDLLQASLGGRSDDLELVEAALASSLKGATLVQQLLAFSRQQPMELKPMDLGAALGEWLPRLRRTLGERIRPELAVETGLWQVIADAAQLETCLSHLALNARDAMPDGGLLSIRARNIKVDESLMSIDLHLKFGDYVVLSVTDTGAGMSNEAALRAFEPFFTTKEPGKGSGLGLSTVFGYVRQAGGTAKIYSELGHGTTVDLYLPRAFREAAAPESKPAAVTATGSGERILVVDDNPDMLRVSVAMLQSLGYRTFEADGPAAALAAIERNGPFDLLFSDIVMPGTMSGVDLAREVRRHGLRTLLTSGFASPVAVHSEATAQGLTVLTKPFRKAELAAKVRALLEAGAGTGATAFRKPI